MYAHFFKYSLYDFFTKIKGYTGWFRRKTIYLFLVQVPLGCLHTCFLVKKCGRMNDSTMTFCLSKSESCITLLSELGSVAGPVIQANGRLTFEDDLRSGGLLFFTTQ